MRSVFPLIKGIMMHRESGLSSQKDKMIIVHYFENFMVPTQVIYFSMLCMKT